MTTAAFNALPARKGLTAFARISDSLHKRGPNFVLGGNGWKFCFDEESSVAYILGWINNTEWVRAFDATVAENPLDVATALARDEAEAMQCQFGDYQLWHAYKDVAYQLLSQLLKNQMPKTERARLEAWEDEYNVA
ncbi:hypothetical protein [Pseudomonas chlororaphis]|uniref:hypothetical protein n=1 Tax=Pseudomonas chlororaphis TaxID=587753 RepID=UPI00046E7F61|nr:hypothetical protein [Pseudomonas chlororaphis]